MKKTIFTLLALSMIFFNASAQYCGNSGVAVCVPSGGPSSGGFEDPNTTPCVVQGQAYNHAIQFTMFSTFTFQGNTVSIDSIRFDDIDSLPCGLCWATNK